GPRRSRDVRDLGDETDVDQKKGEAGEEPEEKAALPPGLSRFPQRGKPECGEEWRGPEPNQPAVVPPGIAEGEEHAAEQRGGVGPVALRGGAEHVWRSHRSLVRRGCGLVILKR